LPFQLRNEDHVIFSSSIIPTKTNIENREKLDSHLKKKGVRIFNNIHVSGHAGREDLRDFVTMLNPEHIIPAHGGPDKTIPMIKLAEEIGYKKQFLHLVTNHQIVSIPKK
jgi:ribonuclease J